MEGMTEYVRHKSEGGQQPHKLHDLRAAVPTDDPRDGQRGRRPGSKNGKPSSKRKGSAHRVTGYESDASEADRHSTNASLPRAPPQPASDYQDSDFLEAEYQATLQKTKPKTLSEIVIKGDSIPSTSDGALTIISHGNKVDEMEQHSRLSQQPTKSQHPVERSHSTAIPNRRAPRGLPTSTTAQQAQHQSQYLSHDHQSGLLHGETELPLYSNDPTKPGGFQFGAAIPQKNVNLPLHKPTVQQPHVQSQGMTIAETVSNGVQNRYQSRQSTRNTVAPAALSAADAQHPRGQMMANTSRPQTAATHVPGKHKRGVPPVPLFNAPPHNPDPPIHPTQHSSDGYVSEEEPDEVEDSDLDHHFDDLAKMDYADLQREPFDKAPDADNFIVHNAPDDASLAEKLSAVLAQTVSGDDGVKIYDFRIKFMASLTIDEWEEAGAWLVQHFGTVVQNFTTVRREKRKAAIAFESEIEARDNSVGAKRSQIRGALDEMKVNGNAVLGTTPKKGRKESKE
ncbi:hypothetical protein B0A48_09255 [Cryoendolithus antarcticus]|uniref:Extracellular mutant protein 11 C-terminal domain-containing protein n=1 Tax=Cryoendolithus antarcticus TaxID=1507870 RepID=A0A1V8T243_9PEZI|nr:hypothetical protein B0A48_09255 [Cryoendolithus antarcticus]